MDYSIRVYKVEKEDSRLKGFVSITFDGSFCAKNIALKESSRGNLYLDMPKYQDYATKEYLPYFAFKDAEFRKAVTDQVVEAYSQIEDKYMDCDKTWGKEELFYDLSVTPISGNNTFKAEAAMKIQDIFVVQRMHVIQAGTERLLSECRREKTARRGQERISHIRSPEILNGNWRQLLWASIIRNWSHGSRVSRTGRRDDF